MNTNDTPASQPVQPVTWFEGMPTGGGTVFRRPTPSVSVDPVDFFRRMPTGGTAYIIKEEP